MSAAGGCGMVLHADRVPIAYHIKRLREHFVLALLLATIFHWLIFLLPWVLLLIDRYRHRGIVLITMGILIRMLSAAFTRQRLRDALLMPVSVLLMTVIAAQSIYWHLTGGPRWKGRTLPNPNDNHTDNAQWTTPSSSSAQASAD